MPLAIPNIASLFSVWTKSLRITGALTGATILVRSIGPSPRDIATGAARGGEDWLGLLPGESIKADDRLVVKQERPGDSSDWTPDDRAYTVTPVPTSASDLQAVEIRSRLWQCGEFVLIKGAFPGAVIEFSYGAAAPETCEAPGGEAHIRLTGKLSAASPVSAKQVTPVGVTSPANTTRKPVQPLPWPSSIPFPPPTLDGPLRACETAVVVRDVYDGAVVTLRRTAHPNELAGFDVDGGWVGLRAPLEEDEYISGIQEMPKCERPGQEGAAVKVGPAEALQPGVSPLCVGGRHALIHNLQPGSVIHFDVNGTSYDLMAPPTEASHSFDIYPPLPAGTVTVTQEICGVVSDPTVVPINRHPALSVKPSLVKPLYACARSVTVRDVQVGAEVQVFARRTGGIGPISCRKIFLSDGGSLEVTPHLGVNNDIWVVETGCDSSLESDHEQVKPHPPIDPPEIDEPVDSGDTRVTLKGVIPTATVYIYLLERDVWIPIGYKPHTEGPTTTVSLDRVVKTKHQLAATQEYCGITTDRGPVVTVVKPRPLAPNIILPKPGSTDVPYQSLAISWSDPGAGKEQAADQFNLELHDMAGQNPVTASSGLKTTSSTVTNLKVGVRHTLKLQGSNSTGMSPWATGTFTTKAPKPYLTEYKQASMTLTGESFPPNATITLHVTHEIIGTIYIKQGVPVKYDNRSKDLVGFTSDTTGKLNQAVDLIGLLDPYRALYPSGGPIPLTVLCKGPLKDEYVLIKARYDTPSLGTIESNVLRFKWEKDTIFIT